jgi:hypothetical protein
MVDFVVSNGQENHMNSTKTLVYRAECHDCDFTSGWAFDRTFAQTEGKQHTKANDCGGDDVAHVTSVHWSER